MKKYILETPRLRLRESTPDDAEFVYNLNLDPEVVRYTGDSGFESVSEARAFLSNYESFKKFGYGRWICELRETGEAIGWCGLKNEAGLIDLGYRFFQKHWNKGYASEAAAACLDYGHQVLKMPKIIARAAIANTGSWRVMEKTGMQKHKEDLNSCGGYPTVWFISRRFSLRNWQESDAESLLKYANNYNIAKNLTDKFPHPYTKQNALDFISMMKESPSVFAIVLDGEAIGGIGLHQQSDVFCKNAELGYWLGEPFWRQGIITAAIEQAVAYGFENMDITRIFARPFGSNIGSQRVLEKAGFRKEAHFEKTCFKFGNFEDELHYAVRKI